VGLKSFQKLESFNEDTIEFIKLGEGGQSA